MQGVPVCLRGGAYFLSVQELRSKVTFSRDSYSSYCEDMLCVAVPVYFCFLEVLKKTEIPFQYFLVLHPEPIWGRAIIEIT